MSDDDDGRLPLDEIINQSLKPTGNDLFEIERRIAAVQAQKADVEAQSKLNLGRSRKLSELAQRRSRLELAQLVAKEHVFVNPQQYQVYLNQKRHAAAKAAEEAARQVQQAPAAETDRSTKRSTLRDYLQKWSAAKEEEPDKANEPGAGPDPTGGGG